MLTQLIKLAVQSIADPDELVTLTNISEGVEGATLFGITEESPDPLKIEDDQTVQQRFRHTINIRGLYDSTDMAQLRTWAGAQTKVRLSGYTVDGFVLFNGDYLLSPNTNFDSVDVTALMVTVEWLGTFSSGYRQIQIGENGLRNYDVTSGTGTLLFGMNAEAGLTVSIAGANQTATRASGSATYVKSNQVFFPFAGVTLTASAFLVSADVANELGLRFFDENGGYISQVTENAIGGGILSATAVVPAGTAFFEFIVNPGDTASDSTIFNEPCVRVGTGTTYTDW